MSSETSNALADAPEHVKLAVDLIMLLEQNELAPQTVLDALAIVERDYQAKRDAAKADQTS